MTLGDIEYMTIKPMDAFTQLKIARRLGPSLPILQGIISDENKNKDKRIITILMFSHISEEDMMFVIGECLSTIGRRQSNGSIANVRKNGSIMFDDMGMDEMLKISIEVIEETLGDFFRTSLAVLESTRDEQKV